MTETLVLTIGSLAAAVISGATGFGFALVATALWSLALEPRLVTVLALVFTTALNLAYLPLFWRDIDLRRLAPFALGAAAGVPLGALVLSLAPSGLLRLWVGGLLLAYGSFMLLRRQPQALPMRPRVARLADTVVGFAGGFFGGLGGLSGFLPALWCGLRGWDKNTNRALVQAYILVANAFSLLWVNQLVGIDERAQGLLLLGLPFVAVGGWLGLRVFARLNTAAFNRAVLWVIAGSGAVLLLR